MAGINRPMSQMRKLEAKESLFRARKRILKYLVLGWLRQEGLLQSAEALVSEAGLGGEYEMCDNIDLDIILQDYCSYYLMRFNKQPQFCRRAEERPPSRRPQTRRARKIPGVEAAVEGKEVPVFTVTKLLQDNTIEKQETRISSVESKPIAGFLANASPEKKAITDLLYQCIIRNYGVAWDDVKGLDVAKNILMESVVYPVRYPDLFTGLLEPWRGVLLHGPPGSGKTLLARAVAGESGCVFFNVTCSTLVNKWRGESEKIVKVLFEMASYFSPSVIFMDEAEALTSERRRDGHEASRRLCSQLLAEMDGVRAREGTVLLMMNTNMPWDIDPAILRRLEKRIFIPLPDHGTRVELFRKYLDVDLQMVPPVDYDDLAGRTEGYSGSDVKLACKEALMSGVRKVLNNGGKNQKKIERISLSDVLEAIGKTKPVSKNLSKRHQDWQDKMGST